METKRYDIFAFLLLTTLLVSVFTVQAQESVTLEPIQNNTLYENSSGDISNGQGDHIFTGTTNNGLIRRALLIFDVSAIPESANVDSVHLEMTMNRTQAENVTVTLHEVLTGWGEGQSKATGQEGTGAAAMPDDATWIHNVYPNSNWENQGGDFDATAISTTVVGALNTYTWESTQEFTDLIQKWVNEPTSNYGLLIKGDESTNQTAKRFASRHNIDEAATPKLTVFYSQEATSNETLVSELPDKPQLGQNYPNPFNPSTVISFTLPEASQVEIAVYDILGRKLQSLVNEVKTAGTHEVSFNAADLSSGTYIYTLETANTFTSRKLTVIK